MFWATQSLHWNSAKIILFILFTILLPNELANAEPVTILQNPNLTVPVPFATDILTIQEGGTIKRCCGTRTCVQCTILDFDKYKGKIPDLKNGQVLRISHPSGDEKKDLYLCPGYNDDTIHQCREVSIQKDLVNPQ